MLGADYIVCVCVCPGDSLGRMQGIPGGHRLITTMPPGLPNYITFRGFVGLAIQVID